MLLDCAKGRLKWPLDLSKINIFAREILSNRENVVSKFIDSQAQQNLIRRDQAIKREKTLQKARKLQESSTFILQRSKYSQFDFTELVLRNDSSNDFEYESQDIECIEKFISISKTKWNSLHRADLKARLSRMKQKLSKIVFKQSTSRVRKSKTNKKLLEINVVLISSADFYHNLYKKDNEFFTTSLYEVDRILVDKRVKERDTKDRENEELIDSLLSLYLHEFKNVFSKSVADEMSSHRVYDHKIVLKDDKILDHSSLYNHSIKELEVLKTYLVNNLAKSFIEFSQALFEALILFVKKSNESLRLCVNYRKLNALTRKDCYSLFLINETLARMISAKMYIKLDIRQTFNRIWMNFESEELITFRSRYDSYKCKVLSFELANDSAIYQRYMNDVFFDYLDDFCTAYMNDIMIYSDNEIEHEIYVKKILQRLRDTGLQVDIRKYEFSVTRTKYLDFIVSIDDLEVDSEKIQVVKDWKSSRTIKDIQFFLDFCNFYRRFIRDYEIVAKSLIRLTRSKVSYVWNQVCEKIFEELKYRLTFVSLIRHYNSKLEIMLETDASNEVIADVISQLHENELWHSIVYFFKIMTSVECNYEIHDKKMLVIIRFLSHWRAELEEVKERIRIYINHKALKYFMTTKQFIAQQARWTEILSQFFFIIMYQSDKDNLKSDVLSRQKENIEAQNKIKDEIRTRSLLRSDQIDSQVLQKYTELVFLKKDELEELLDLIDRILRANREFEFLKALRIQAENDDDQLQLQDDFLIYEDKLLMLNSEDLRADLIRETHAQVSFAHSDQHKTYLLLQLRYY